VLLVVSDGSADATRVCELAAAAAAGRAWGFLVREPMMPAALLYQTAARLVDAHPDLRVLVSDRLDVALAAGAAGVQLGERGLPVERARALCGTRLGLGRSVHDLACTGQAAEAGADWLVFGNVYVTTSKPGKPGTGLGPLERAARAAGRVPLLAIGGVTEERVPELLARGASGVAVIGAVAGDPSPPAAVGRLVRALERARRTGSVAAAQGSGPIPGR
jgi:thiamine-phosphate diphosphorylase